MIFFYLKKRKKKNRPINIYGLGVEEKDVGESGTEKCKTQV